MLKKAASKLAGLIGDHIFRCVRRTQELGDGKRRQFSRLRKNYCGTVEIQWFARLGQQESTAQDAQKGRPARPQRAKRRRRTLRYVEPLSDARTPLAGFFSILPILHLHYVQEPGIEGSITTALCGVRVLRFILGSSFDECAVA